MANACPLQSTMQAVANKCIIRKGQKAKLRLRSYISFNLVTLGQHYIKILHSIIIFYLRISISKEDILLLYSILKLLENLLF